MKSNFASCTTRTSCTTRMVPSGQLWSQILSVSNEMQDLTSRTTCTCRTTRQAPLTKTLPANSKRWSFTMWYLTLSHWNITQSPLAPIEWIQRLISLVYHSYNLKHTQQDYHDLNSQTDSENLLSFTSLQTLGPPIRTENYRRKHPRQGLKEERQLLWLLTLTYSTNAFPESIVGL